MATATAAQAGKTQPRLKQKYNDEIKKALRLKASLSDALDQLQ